MSGLFIWLFGICWKVFPSPLSYLASLLTIFVEETASRIEFWLQSINARANGAGVILVGTHADEVQRRGTVKNIIKFMREKYVILLASPRLFSFICFAFYLLFSRYCTRFNNIVDIVPVSLATGKGTQEYVS